MAALELFPLLDSLLSGQVHTATAFQATCQRLAAGLPALPSGAVRDYVKRGVIMSVYDRSNSESLLSYISSNYAGDFPLKFTLRCDEFTPLKSRRTPLEEFYLDSETCDDAVERVITTANAVNKLTHAVENAAKRGFNALFAALHRIPAEDKCKELAAKLIARDVENAQRQTLAAGLVGLLRYRRPKKFNLDIPKDSAGVVKSFLQLAGNAEKKENSLKSVLLRWKLLMLAEQNSEPDLYKPSKLNRALEKVARTPLRTGLSEIQRDRRTPAEKLHSALLRSARVPQHFGLNAIRTSSKLAGVQKFSLQLSNLDCVLNKMHPTDLRSAFLLWAKNADKIRNLKENEEKEQKENMGKLLRAAFLTGNKRARWTLKLWLLKALQKRRLTEAGPSLALISQLSAVKSAFARNSVSSAYNKIKEKARKQKLLESSLSRFSTFQEQVAVAKWRSRVLLLRLVGAKKTAVAKRVLIAASNKTAKAFATWRGKLDQSTLKTTVSRYFIAAQKLESVGIHSLAAPLRKVVGIYPKLRNVINSLNFARFGRVKARFDIWKVNAEKAKNAELALSEQGRRLQFALLRIPRKTYKSSLDAIRDDGKRANAALRALALHIQNSEKRAFYQWKQSLLKDSAEKAENKAKGQKMNHTLEKIARKPLRSGFAKKPEKTITEVGLKLCNTLEKVPIRTLKQGFERIVSDGSVMRGRLLLLAKVYENRLRAPMSQWQQYLKLKAEAENCLSGKAQKLQNALHRVPLKVLSAAFAQVTDKGTVLHLTALRLVRAMLNRPKAAVSLWHSNVEERKNREQSIAKCAALLQGKLLKAAIRVRKTALDRIAGTDDKLKKAIRAIMSGFGGRPKSWFALWRRFVVSVKQRRLLDAAKSQKLQNALHRLPDRTAKSAFDRLVFSAENKMKSILRGLIIGFRDRQLRMVNRWRAAVVKSKQEQDKQKLNALKLEKLLLNTARRPLRSSLPSRKGPNYDLQAQKLKSALEPLPKPVMKLWILRLFNRNEIASARIGAMLQVMKNFPRLALAMWKKYAEMKAKKVILLRFKGEKLNTATLNAAKRPISAAFARVANEEKALRKTLQVLVHILKERPRGVVQDWHKRAEAATAREFEVGKKAALLQAKLLKFPMKQEKEAIRSIVSKEERLKSALRGLALAVTAGEKRLFDLWKLGIMKKKQEVEARKFAGERVQSALKPAVRRILRSAMPSPKDKSIDLKGQRLRALMENTAKKAVNPGFSRVVNKPDLVSARLAAMAQVLKNYPRLALTLWKNYATVKKAESLAKKSNEIERGRRAALLLAKLSAIGRKPLHDSMRRIAANDGKLKTAIRSLLLNFQDGQRRLFDRWKAALVKKSEEQEAAKSRAHKLQSVLNKTARKPLRSSLPSAKGPNFDLKGQRLKAALAAASMSTIRIAFDGIINRRRLLVKARVGELVQVLKNFPRLAVYRWKTNAAEKAERTTQRDARARKLKELMESVVKKPSAIAVTKVMNGDSRVKGAIRAIVLGFTARSHQWFSCWKTYASLKKEKVAARTAKAQQLKSLFLSLPNRPNHCALLRLTQSPESRLQSAIRGLVLSITATERRVFESLKLAAVKTKQELEAQKFKGEKVQSVLKPAIRRTLRSAMPSAKDPTVILKGQRLRALMENVSKRAVNPGFKGIIRTDAAMKKVLLALVHVMKERPKAAIQSWHQTAEDRKYATENRPRQAALFSIKIQRLLQKPEKFAIDRVTQSDNKLKNAVRALLFGFTVRPKLWFAQWRLFAYSVKQRKLLDAQKAEKLRNCLQLVPSRAAKSGFDGITRSPEQRLKSVLRGLIVGFSDRQLRLFNRWKAAIVKAKEETSTKQAQAYKLQAVLKNTARKPLRASMPSAKGPSYELKGQKLRAAMEAVPKWRLRGAMDKLLNRNTLLSSRLSAMLQVMKNFPRLAFSSWRNNAQNLTARRLLLSLKAHKASELALKVADRTMRSALYRTVGRRERLKKGLFALISTARNRPKSAFSLWRQFVSEKVEKGLQTESKGNRLNYLFFRLCKLHLPPVLFRLRHNNVPILQSTTLKVLRPVEKRKFDILQAVREFAFLKKALDKQKGAHQTIDLSKKDDRENMRTRLRHWHFIAMDEIRRIKRWVVFSFINNTPLTIQAGFWKWKIIKRDPGYIFPEQCTFFKRVGDILNRVNRVAIVRSFEKIALGRMKHLTAEVGASPMRLHSRPSEFDSYRSLADEDEDTSHDNIRQTMMNKMTPSELRIARQSGGVEVVGLTLRSAVARLMMYALVSIRDQGVLQEFKEANEMLTDDLMKLQMGNERLMATFKESTISLDTLSKKLDLIKTERMVRMLEKVRTVLPAYEAILMLKMNAGIAII